MASVVFQTAAMGDAFASFPRVLLVHRAGELASRALYIFLVAGPAQALGCGMARVVYLAILQDESAGSLAHMYGAFRASNPAWTETQLLLVGPDLPNPPVLAQAFPTAELRLSIFHLCKRLQQQVQQLALEDHAEHLILASLSDTMYGATESSRRKTHAVLRNLVTPDMLPHHDIDWLLDDEIWAAHGERTWGESHNYFRDLEMVIQGLSQVFSVECSLESSITSLVQHYQRCVSDAAVFSASCPDCCGAQADPQSLPASGLPLAPLACQCKPLQNPVQASLTTAEVQQQQPVAASLTTAKSPVSLLWSLLTAPQHQSETPQALLLQGKPANPQSSLDPSPPAAKLQATEIPVGASEEEINQRTEEHIKQSLRDICTEPAARLCLSEFAAVQKSVQLIGTGENDFSIQVLEDAQSVGLRGCTCHFNQVFQLPCRHILAVLNSDRNTLQPEMLSEQQQKGRAGQDSTHSILEVLKSSWNESLDKSLLVSFLTTEISWLLTHCSGEEFERRYRTLRELADSWIGPYFKVKL